MSSGSPEAITADSKSSAVATTKASTAFADDMRAFSSSAPARWAVFRVRSTTRIASRFNSWFIGASKRGPRQTSAKTGAGTRTNAPRSCATRVIARARTDNTPRSSGRASAVSASESSISASATLVWLASARRQKPDRVQRPTRRETHPELHVRVHAQRRESRRKRGHDDPLDDEQQMQACEVS